MGERKPSVDSLWALWRELSRGERLVMVASRNRPQIKAFLQKLLGSGASLEEDGSPSELYAPELIPEGWEVIQDVAPTLSSVKNLGVVWISHRGNAKANLGLADLKVALADIEEMPAMEIGSRIIFTGTFLKGPEGKVYHACLSWDGENWSQGWFDIHTAYREFDRLALLGRE